MFCCLLKKELTFTLSRLETNNVSFSQVKFLVFEAQPVFSKLSEAAPLNERDRISITSTPSLHYRTVPTSICKSRALDSTAARVILECPSCPLHLVPRGYHELLALNDETIDAGATALSPTFEEPPITRKRNLL